uniref:Interleukin-1 beta n=1 Tax=Scophthalmus maximus TaxID=52904 RepID=A0A8D3AM04_SCOMX
MEYNMECNMSEMWSNKMPQGLDLEISHHPMTMRRVVNLIIAMERLRAGAGSEPLGTEFRDENLLSVMLESIVEEHIVFERSSSPPDQFSRTGVHRCSVTDEQKRNFVLVRNSMELHAVMLQGGSDNRKVNLNMSTYVHPSPSTEARPVALGIRGTNLYLSCQQEDGVPTLHLEVRLPRESRVTTARSVVTFDGPTPEGLIYSKPDHRLTKKKTPKKLMRSSTRL